MKSRHFHYLTLLIFLAIIIIFAYGIGHVSHFMSQIYTAEEIADENLLPKIGTFGDSAGLLNALFSSLAFGGVILTIIWQVSENIRQRKDEHRIQFESVFFNMTNTLEEIVSELKVEYEKTASLTTTMRSSAWGVVTPPASPATTPTTSMEPEFVTGRAVFKYLYEDRPLPLMKVIEKEGIEGFEREMYGMLDNYFRYLYRILKYIDGSKLINAEEKCEYAGMLRAHLSYMELIMVYYNCLSEYGCEKFKPLVERYHLLKNIRWGKLHNSKLNGRVIGVAKEDMYDESAWESEKKEIMKENEIGSFCWKMVFALLFALIFNTLIADWWHDNVIIRWEGMYEVVIRGLVLIAVTLSLFYYLYRDGQYRKMYMAVKETRKPAYSVWNLLKGNYTLPVFLFLLITSVYTCIKHQVVWYDTHTVYLDLTFFYFPLMADVIALIVNAVRAADEQTATNK